MGQIKLEPGSLLFIKTSDELTLTWKILGSAICIRTKKPSYVMYQEALNENLIYPVSDVHSWMESEEWPVLRAKSPV